MFNTVFGLVLFYFSLLLTQPFSIYCLKILNVFISLLKIGDFIFIEYNTIIPKEIQLSELFDYQIEVN